MIESNTNDSEKIKKYIETFSKTNMNSCIMCK